MNSLSAPNAFPPSGSLKTLVVIGGGAAGFFCAVTAARQAPDLKVIIVEKSSKLLSKVKVSGGGRCNVTHNCRSLNELVQNYPRGQNFLKRAFHNFSHRDTVAWFEERGVELKTEADGRMFPVTDSSQTIIDCLLQEAAKCRVEIRMNTSVTVMDTRKDGEGLILRLSTGSELPADFVCVACGGYAKDEQFAWLHNLDLKVLPPVPSLFTFNIPGSSIGDLMGITLQDCSVRIHGSKLQQRGPILITHWGLSGPAILKLSAWAALELAKCNYDFIINVSWLPLYNEATLREKMLALRFEHASQKIQNRNPFGLPSRFWLYILQEAGILDDIRWADLPAKSQNILIKLLCTQEFNVKGKTTFKEEFVTAGGVEVEQVDPNTMGCKAIPGLFFAGEVLNIDAVTGGFNFQNAWTTGFVAGNAISARVQSLRFKV